jgi:hypothetical protein
VADGFSASAFGHLLKEFSNLEEQHHKDGFRELGFGPGHESYSKGAKGGYTHEEILAEGLSVNQGFGRLLEGVPTYNEVRHKVQQKILPGGPGGVFLYEPGGCKKYGGGNNFYEPATAFLFLLKVMVVVMLMTAVMMLVTFTFMIMVLMAAAIRVIMMIMFHIRCVFTVQRY